MRRIVGLVVAAVAVARAPRPAAADDNDLVLSRLATLVDQGEELGRDAVGDNQAFRSLVSELGVVMAPRMGDPADTLGWGGFALSADLAFTGISADTAPWRALESSPDPAGEGVTHGESVMTTVGVFAKKGLWLPLPSFEMGLGVVHLLRSRLWAAQFYGKVALHEGYPDAPMPSVALRAGVSRMTGSTELNLTVLAVDLIVSKDFGVGGTFRLSPYLGIDVLSIIARSEVIDGTPEVDPMVEITDDNADFAFVDQDPVWRTRLVAGGKLTYSALTFGLEAAIARAGTSEDDQANTTVACASTTAPTAACDSVDEAARQTTITLTLGADF
jgi:hypothetical protein